MPPKEKATPQVGYKYNGNGDYLMDIPARDLSLNDVALFSEEQRDTLEQHCGGENAIYSKLEGGAWEEDFSSSSTGQPEPGLTKSDTVV